MMQSRWSSLAAPASGSVAILPCRTHRLSRSESVRLISSGGAGSAEAAIGVPDVHTAESPRCRRPKRTPVSEAEASSTHAYLQGALDIDAAAARSLTLRTKHPSLLQLSSCQGWVTYLTQLGGGDASAALTVLQTSPQLLNSAFDKQRQEDLDQLLQCLSTALGITPAQLSLMARRRPMLLCAAVPTVTAAAAFLLSLHRGDATATADMVLTEPQLLTASLETLQEKMQNRTAGQSQLSTDAAMRQLGQLGSRAVNGDRQEPLQQWLLRQEFTPDQAHTLAHGTTRLLGIGTDVLQHRLGIFAHTCGIPAGSVRQMLTRQPGLWLRDMHSHVCQLKLQYWQQELGYSLSSLPLVFGYMTYSLASIASRHSVLRDMLGTAPSPAVFMGALIGGRAGTKRKCFASKALGGYIKLHSAAGGGGSLQDLLLPLSARLSQAAHKQEWAAALQAGPPLASAGGATLQHHQLYAALDGIAQRDWPLSAHGQMWTAAAEEAAAADRDGVVRQRDARAAARAVAPSPRARSTGGATRAAAAAVSAAAPTVACSTSVVAATATTTGPAVHPAGAAATAHNAGRTAAAPRRRQTTTKRAARREEPACQGSQGAEHGDPGDSQVIAMGEAGWLQWYLGGDST